MTPRCTLAYAAPEILAAHTARRRVPSDPAQDVWALGVMAYEALTHSSAFPQFASAADIVAAAAGTHEYVWEGASTLPAFAKSRARRLIGACLERDARKRPSAGHLLRMIDALGHETTASAALR